MCEGVKVKGSGKGEARPPPSGRERSSRLAPRRGGLGLDRRLADLGKIYAVGIGMTVFIKSHDIP